MARSTPPIKPHRGEAYAWLMPAIITFAVVLVVAVTIWAAYLGKLF